MQKIAEALKIAEMEYDNQRNKESKIKLNEATVAHVKYLATKSEFWRQKTAIKWIREGDANTAYFHAVLRH